MGNFVGDQGPAAPFDEFVAGDALDVFFEHHVSFDAFTDSFIRHAHRAGSDHRRVFLQHGFDFRGRHPVALVFNGIHRAIHKVEVTVLIHGHDVGGAIPFFTFQLDKGLGGFLGFVQVA